MGVCIETDKGVDVIKEGNVTPYMGVCIETPSVRYAVSLACHTLYGCVY